MHRRDRARSGRDRRAPVRRRGLAGHAVLHRRRAGRAGADRGRHPAGRPAPIRCPTRSGRRPPRHYDEQQLAALVLAIAEINVWNRLNVATARRRARATDPRSPGRRPPRPGGRRPRRPGPATPRPGRSSPRRSARPAPPARPARSGSARPGTGHGEMPVGTAGERERRAHRVLGPAWAGRGVLREAVAQPVGDPLATDLLEGLHDVGVVAEHESTSGDASRVRAIARAGPPSSETYSTQQWMLATTTSAPAGGRARRRRGRG